MHVHTVLLQMIKQDFTVRIPRKDPKDPKGIERMHIWEVRHAGLLGIKYEVAVRSDLFQDSEVKLEAGGMATGRELLQDVVQAAILGYDLS